MTITENIKIDTPKYTVLIVDDNPTNLGVVADYLKDYGFKTPVASSGELGLKRAKFIHPDIILLDVMMPGIDGFETCRRLKADAETKDIPVVFMTALASTEDKVTGFEVGAVDYVTKPLQQEEVLARITTHLSIRDLTRRLQKKNVQLEASSEVAQQITSILELPELLVKMVELIQTKFAYYFVGVWLLDYSEDGANGNNLTLRASHGRNNNLQIDQEVIIPLDTPNAEANILLRVCQSGQLCLADEGNLSLKLLVLPLRVGQKILGVLDIRNETPFNNEDQTILQTLAAQIAIAIRNAQLYERQKNLRHMEEERARGLAELNASKDRFFSIVAHDLRGPFQPLMGMSELLYTMADSIAPKDIREMGTTINRSAKNIFNLLENLLQWSRMQMGRMPFEPEKLHLRSIVEATISLLATNASDKGITLQDKVRPGVFVWADPNILDMVIRNLISNALKFTPSGGQIIVSSNQTNPLVEVSVTDTGVGISQADQEKLFKIDVHHSTLGTAKEQGTGLGLVICKDMVEKNGGHIWVESELGQGTTVKFTVPFDSLTDAGLPNIEFIAAEKLQTAKISEILVPPPAELNKLLQLATIGDMSGIKAWAIRQDPQYEPFARKLQELANDFEEEAILAMARKYAIVA